MSDAEDQHEHAGVFDFRDEAVVADAIFPKLAESGTVQSLADAARIFERREALVQRLENALALLRVEFLKLAGSGGGQFNLPGHLFEKFFQWDGLFLTLLNAVEGFLGEIEILEIVEVFEDGFADVKSFGAASASGEFFETLFDGFGKTDG